MENEILDEIFNGTPELNEEAQLEAEISNEEAARALENLQQQQESPQTTTASTEKNPKQNNQKKKQKT